jgi:hypothetical protein
MIEVARDMLRMAGFYVDKLWHVDDVHFICEQLEVERLDDTEVRQVFEIASENFDGETGISWPQLERALQLYLRRKHTVRELYSIAEPNQQV